MADCPPATICGCSGSGCPTVPEPDAGAPAPGTEQNCGCDSASDAQQSENTIAPDCCDGGGTCPDSEGGNNSGSSDWKRSSTGVPGLDDAINRARRLRQSVRPRIPGTWTKSPGINPANGNVFYKLPVVHSGAYAPPSFLTYNSRAAGNAIQYGSGTAGLYNQTITKIDDDTADVIKGDGSSWRYTDRDGGTGYYLAPAGARNSLQRVSGGWLETQPDGLQLVYNDVDSGAFGRLDRIVNRGSQTWTLTYDSLALSSILDPFNRRTTYAYDGSGNLQRIQDHAGRVTTFTVDGSGNLTQVTTPELCLTQLVYDGDHRMTAYVDPAGNRTSYSYDIVNRVTSVTRPRGEVTTFTYLGNELKTTDARGLITTVSFDVDRNITAVMNPLGQRTSYTWADNWLTAVEDANSQRTTLIYETGMTDGTTPIRNLVQPDGGRFT
jgi:YD repeat-containing protein